MAFIALDVGFRLKIMAELESVRTRVRNNVPNHRDPHAFHEEKSEITRRLTGLLESLRTGKTAEEGTYGTSEDRKSDREKQSGAANLAQGRQGHAHGDGRQRGQTEDQRRELGQPRGDSPRRGLRNSLAEQSNRPDAALAAEIAVKSAV